MKKQTIELNTFIWSGWQLDCPIEAIGEFFEHFPLDKSKEHIKQMVLLADSNKSYCGHRPNLAIDYYFALSTLFRSCFYILQDEKKQKGIWVKLDDVCKWDCGNLSKEEYQNPIIFLEEVFRYKEIKDWERVLLDLTYAAILNESVGSVLVDLADICYLYQIIDASWIIQQRAYPILQQEMNADKEANTLQNSTTVSIPINNDTPNPISNQLPEIDIFSSTSWSGTAYSDAHQLLQDIFSNDEPVYYKDHINLLLESQLLSKPISSQNIEDVFRVYSRVNSLIQAAYYYQQHTQIIINTVIVVHSKSYWQMEWNYFVQHGLVGKQCDDPSELFALVYVVQSILEELHKIYLEKANI